MGGFIKGNFLLGGFNCLISGQTALVNVSHPVNKSLAVWIGLPANQNPEACWCVCRTDAEDECVCIIFYMKIAKRLDSFQCVDFSFEGQSWKSRRKRPSGEACKYCLPCGYFSCWNALSGLFFFLNWSKKTSLWPEQTTQTYKMRSHPLLDVIYVIITLSVCQ